MNALILRNARIQSFSRASLSVFGSVEAPFPFTNTQLSSLQLRKASSSTSTPTRTTTSSSQDTPDPLAATSSTHPISRVNGPLSTLPAVLTVPTRQPSQSRPGYLFSIGKAYLSFYKTGGKNIWANFKTTRPLQDKLDSSFDGSLRRAVEQNFLDRTNFQLIHRTRFDLRRVPIFGLVFAICGEFTPLVVLAIPSIVPFTCRIPRQIEGDRKKLEARRKISFRNLTTPLPVEAQIFSAESAGSNHAPIKVVDTLQRMQLIHISWSLGLSSSLWDWLGGQLPGLPTAILRRKVARRVEYLEMDDELIGRDGGVAEMSMEEIKIAAVERGIDVLDRKESLITSELQSWVAARKTGASVERLLLSRPSVWSRKEV